MTSTTKSSSKINSVLARFEETIEQNNAVGVCSGMYLTNQVGHNKGGAAKSFRRSSATMGSVESSSPADASRRRASVAGAIKPGMYRDMVSNTPCNPKKEKMNKDSAAWDPFHETDSSVSDDEEDESESASSDHGKVKLQRPRSQKSAGRRSARKTRTKGALHKSKRNMEPKEPSVDTCTTKDETDSGDDDEGSAFSVTYVGNRDKFLEMQRQNSEKSLTRSASQRRLHKGSLEMTRQDSASSLTKKKSRSKSRDSPLDTASSSHRRKEHSRGSSSRDLGRSDTSREQSTRSPPSKRVSARLSSRHPDDDDSRQRTSSRHHRGLGNTDEEGAPSPRRTMRSTRNFSKSRHE